MMRRILQLIDLGKLLKVLQGQEIDAWKQMYDFKQ